MAYDTSKLSKLAHLKDLAERLYAKQTALSSELSTLSDKVDNLVTAGGEPNVIESVKVNGTALTITNKAVDVTVPTAVSELTNDSGYQTASDVATAVAEIVADAPEAYDTLKEIADWISTHADSASTMNTAINTNASDIATLKALIGTLPETATSTNVIAYISEMIDSIEEYTHPTYTAQASGLYKITVDGTGHVSAVEEVTEADIAALGVKTTDTTYTVATTTADGLMSSTDKSKLDGIAEGATANTGTITGVTVTGPISGGGEAGSVNISHAASGAAEGEYGDNAAQTPAFGGTFKVNYAAVNETGHVTSIASHSVTIPSTAASATANGLMSSTDKSKLDGMEIATDEEVTEMLDEVFAA